MEKHLKNEKINFNLTFLSSVFLVEVWLILQIRFSSARNNFFLVQLKKLQWDYGSQCKRGAQRKYEQF